MEIPRAFYLGAYPVTQREWQEVMGNNPSYFSRNGEGSTQVESILNEELAEFPVENVSWDEAQEYIRVRNGREQDSGWEYRLPRESEWEYACRGAAITPEECSFNYYLDRPSNFLTSLGANINGNYLADSEIKGSFLERPTRVGCYSPNRLGLLDMHGNVWEWCEDLYRKKLSGRVLRGGCWESIGGGCSAAERFWCKPANRGNTIGFRLVRVLAG